MQDFVVSHYASLKSHRTALTGEFEYFESFDQNYADYKLRIKHQGFSSAAVEIFSKNYHFLMN